MTSQGSLRVLGLPAQRVLVTFTFCMLASQRSRGAPVSHTADGAESEERWLADQSFYELEYDEEKPQADGRQLAVSNLCPPVPKRLPLGGCDLAQCSSDRECTDKQLKCCYNGCVYTCLPEIKPPPYFDWIREPSRRLQFGQSWLVPGPNLQLDVMRCSTTASQEDSDPLVCPHGYECSIDDDSRPAEGIPNSGHCVKVADDVTDVRATSPPGNDSVSIKLAGDAQEDTASLHACHLEDHMIILSGHAISFEGQNCQCQETLLVCDDTPTMSTT
ncbi:hypothetical protein BsWGS_26787 [Bradybaena similaris]